MAAQTGPQTSTLQKILGYFELAARLGTLIPNAHVDAIAMLIETLTADLTSSQLLSPHAALQASAARAQVKATVAAQVVPGSQVVKSTF